MGQKYTVEPSSIPQRTELVNPTTVNPNQNVSFNFRPLCTKGGKFEYNNRERGYFVKLLERLRDLSTMSRGQLIAPGGKGLRCHPIRFTDQGVSESSFGIPGQDIDEDAWQFEISSNKHGRVHGYFVGSVFYIVWLDPDHALYPRQR
jgi:hypothetical protein